MTHKEALRLALEALELCTNQGMIPMYLNKNKEAITAIKFALANEALERKAENARELGLDYEPLEAKDEPVAAESKFDIQIRWAPCSIEHHNLVQSEPNKWPGYQTRLLYTTPPQRKPLTDEEIGAILEGVNAYGTRLYTFARAIEAAHGIKGEA